MNTSYEKLSFYNSFFGGTIEGDNIMTTDFYGNKSTIGVTMKKYQETLDLLNTYYNKLVDLGVIEKEKTPEEVAKEQQEMMKTMMMQMQAMQAKIDSMNEVNHITKENNDGYESVKNEHYEQNEPKSSSTTIVEPINRKSTGNAQFGEQSFGSIDKSKC